MHARATKQPPHRAPAPQRIAIAPARTFQAAAVEPLGDDWHAELTSLLRGKAAATAAIQRAQTNADPGVAQLRSDAAFLQHAYTALPEGDAREGLLERSAALRTEAEQLVAAAGLQPTEVRTGKQRRRREGRHPEDKVVHALYPGRSKRRRSAAAQEVAPENQCDPLPKLAKKGMAVTKVCACIGRQGGRQAGRQAASGEEPAPCSVRIGHPQNAGARPDGAR
jgi:hypothetical protein